MQYNEVARLLQQNNSNPLETGDLHIQGLLYEGIPPIYNKLLSYINDFKKPNYRNYNKQMHNIMSFDNTINYLSQGQHINDRFDFTDKFSFNQFIYPIDILNKPSKQFNFNGIDNDIILGNDQFLNIQDELSISFNLKLNSYPDDEVFLLKRGQSTGSNYQYSISIKREDSSRVDYLQSRIIIKQHDGTSEKILQQSDVLTLNQWVNIIVTFKNNGKIKLYINNVLDNVTDQLQSTRTESYYTKIGQDTSNQNTEVLDGQMFDFKMFSKELTHDDIIQLQINPININKDSYTDTFNNIVNIPMLLDDTNYTQVYELNSGQYLNINGQVSQSNWIDDEYLGKIFNNEGTQVIQSRQYQGTHDDSFSIFIENDKIYFYIGTDNTQYKIENYQTIQDYLDDNYVSQNINYGQWYHLSCQYNGSSFHIQIDGVIQDSKPKSGNILWDKNITTFEDDLNLNTNDVDVTIESQGQDDGDYQRIFVDGTNQSTNLRGMNIVKLDNFGNFVEQVRYDTYGSETESDNMLQYLNQIEENYYVLIQVRDQQSMNLTEQLKDKLRQLGSNEIQYMGHRDSWLFMTRIGYQHQILEKLSHRYNGQVSDSYTIYNSENYIPNSTYFGYINDIELYSKTLTEEELKWLMIRPFFIERKTDDDLLNYYKLQGTQEEYFYDRQTKTQYGDTNRPLKQVNYLSKDYGQNPVSFYSRFTNQTNSITLNSSVNLLQSNNWSIEQWQYFETFDNMSLFSDQQNTYNLEIDYQGNIRTGLRMKYNLDNNNLYSMNSDLLPKQFNHIILQNNQTSGIIEIYINGKLKYTIQNNYDFTLTDIQKNLTINSTIYQIKLYNTLRTQQEIEDTMNRETYDTTNLELNIIGNEQEGNTLFDYSSNHNSQTISGHEWIKDDFVFNKDIIYNYVNNFSLTNFWTIKNKDTTTIYQPVNSKININRKYLSNESNTLLFWIKPLTDWKNTSYNNGTSEPYIDYIFTIGDPQDTQKQFIYQYIDRLNNTINLKQGTGVNTTHLYYNYQLDTNFDNTLPILFQFQYDNDTNELKLFINKEQKDLQTNHIQNDLSSIPYIQLGYREGNYSTINQKVYDLQIYHDQLTEQEIEEIHGNVFKLTENGDLYVHRLLQNDQSLQDNEQMRHEEDTRDVKLKGRIFELSSLLNNWSYNYESYYDDYLSDI